MLPKLNPSLPHPRFADLTIADRNMLGKEMEIRLPSEEYKRVRGMRKATEAAMWNVVNDALGRGALAHPDLVKDLHDSENAYFPVREELMRQPGNKNLVDPYHREDFDITPPRHPKKLNIMTNIPVWTSGMRDIFPGTDPEHRAFLQKHRALYHLPERIGSLGGAFVSPPDCTLQEQQDILTHMREADPYWRTAPRVFENTTVGEFRKLMKHFEDGWPAVVEDAGGTVLGVMDLKMLPNDAKDHASISEFYDKDGFASALAPSDIYDPDDAFDYMEARKKEYLFRFSTKRADKAPLVMTKSMPYYYSVTKPFEFEGGLGSVVYLGVSDPEKSKADLRTLAQFKIAGTIVDTAHGFMASVEMLLRDMKNEHPYIPIGTGSFNNPLAVRVYSKFLDFIKGPIGSGGVCNTYHTGVHEHDAYASIVIAAAANGEIPILLDGIGGGRNDLEDYRIPQFDDTSEYTTSLALPWVMAKQGGGSILARVESCNPFETRKGIEGRFASGEGSANANKRKMLLKVSAEDAQKNRRDRQKKAAHAMYSEGVNDKFYPTRHPHDLPDFFYLLAMRQRAAMSYALSIVPTRGPDYQPGDHMKYYQENAVVEHKGS